LLRGSRVRLWAASALFLASVGSACGPTAGDGSTWITFEHDGKADDADRAVEPTCASPLFHSLFRAAVRAQGNGTVPSSLLASAESRAEPGILVRTSGYGEIGELLETAQHEVDLQVYSWREGSERAQEVLGGLKRLEAARRAVGAPGPVTVRILIDTMTTAPGGSGLITSAMPSLAAQIEALGLDPAFVKVELAAYNHLATGALHSKALVIDGRTAVVGSGNANWDDQRDLAFQVEGKVALALLADFDDAWRRSWLWTCGSQKYLPLDQCAIATEWLGPIPHQVLPPAPEVAAACVPMLISSRPASANLFSNSVDNPQDQIFLAALREARARVRIETPNLNDDAAKQGIVDAAVRGTIVEIVLSKDYEDFTESLPGQGGTNVQNVAELYQTLAQAGVTDACSRLQIRWYSHDGVTAVQGQTGNNHVKYLSADEQIVIVGSANMDTQSWNKSRELNVVIDEAATTGEWDRTLFEPDFSRSLPVEQCP